MLKCSFCIKNCYLVSFRVIVFLPSTFVRNVQTFQRQSKSIHMNCYQRCLERSTTSIIQSEEILAPVESSVKLLLISKRQFFFVFTSLHQKKRLERACKKLMLFINSKFQALTQYSFSINLKALCKNDNIIILTSQVVKVRHREETTACRLSSKIVADPGAEADLLCHSPVLTLCFVRLSLHILKQFLKHLKKPGLTSTAKCIFLDSLSIYQKVFPDQGCKTLKSTMFSKTFINVYTSTL